MSLQHSVKARLTVLYLATFLLSIWSLSFYLIDTLRKDIEQMLAAQQYSTVSVVADQVNRALEHRFQALEGVAKSSVLAMRSGPAAMQSLLDHRPLFQTLFNGGVIAFDTAGTAMAEVPLPARRIGTNYMGDETVSSALSKGVRAVGPPVIGKKLRAAVFGMSVPIKDSKGRVIGALTGVVNLEEPSFLDDISERIYGKTGGYLLVSGPGQRVITASDKSRIMEALPMSTLSPLKRHLLQGSEDTAITVNRRGVEVLASARVIPATGWVLLVELPTSEVYAPLNDMRLRVFIATLFLSLMAGALTWWVIGHQLEPLGEAARTLAKYPDLGALPEPLRVSRPDEIGQLIHRFNHLLKTLAEREQSLKQSEAFKDAILNSLAAEIAVLDETGVIRAVNEPWLRFSIENSSLPGGPAPNTGIGANYLQACRAADGGPGSEGATKAHDGIKAVLEGREPAFNLEYPCHSADTQRWYTMIVMPLGYGKNDGVVITHTDITPIKQAEESLRIAAVAFECQEGILVMDAQWRILQMNRGFSRITGYLPGDAIGRPPAFLRPPGQSSHFYGNVWSEVHRTGSWQGELVHRRKSGEEFPGWLTVTAVSNDEGVTTHYVSTLTDTTDRHNQEQLRLEAEKAQRDALVREVHHRIKNNLQGITGVLRLFAQSHPETAEPMSQAISQVRSLAVLHGLQGRTPTETVRLCELIKAIATDAQSVWQTPINVDVPVSGQPCVITDSEAVPIALILNELIVNAVKHGGKAHGYVTIGLARDTHRDTVEVAVRNCGKLPADISQSSANRNGLGMLLVQSLMPPKGAHLASEQSGDEVVTRLRLSAPVIHRSGK